MDNGCKFVIVAKKYKTTVNGPASIVQGIMEELERRSIPYTSLLLKEDVSKMVFLINLWKSIRLKEESIVNVHTDGILLPMMVYLLSKMYRKHHYYLTVHGIYKIESSIIGRTKRVYIILEKYLYKHFPNIICVSEMLKNNLEELFDRKKNVLVIPNPCNAQSDKQYVKRKHIEIISVGGLRRRKGIKNIIELAELMKNRGINYHISIYGRAENNNENWFHKELDKLGLNNYIDYCGIVTEKQDIYDKIKIADFQVCLSLYDTFNVAIAESLILGCPCITTNMCGASYLVEQDKNGVVVDLNTIREEGYEHIIRYICEMSEEKRREIIKDCIKYKDVLSWESNVDMYLNLQ